MRKRLEHWRLSLSPFGTGVTLGQGAWWLLSAAGGIGTHLWAANQFSFPLAAFIGLVTFAALLWARHELVRRRQQRSDTRNGPLNELRNSGVALLGHTILTDSDLPEWEASVEEWLHWLGVALERRYGKSTADFVTVIGTYDPKQAIVGSLNARHNQKRGMLQERIKRLELILNRPSIGATAASKRIAHRRGRG